MTDEATLLGARCGSIVAPAGSGKTELIARAVSRPDGAGSLILTHTHAGVKALRDRLRRLGVDRRRAQVETIAGWCLRYGLAYPATSQLTSDQPVSQDWESVYDGALRLLGVRGLQRVIRASYSRILVDEYQDCNRKQHAIITALATCVPTCVLGDPLQGVFGFGGGTLRWHSEVEQVFTPLGTLTEQWRWKAKNEELGRWLLDLRRRLIAGLAVDLTTTAITRHESATRNRLAAAGSLAREVGSVVAIHKWPQDAHALARELAGSYQSMEEIECKDLLKFADVLDKATGPRRALTLLVFSSDCFTEVGAALASVQAQLARGVEPDSAAHPSVGAIVDALVMVANGRSTDHVLSAMRQIERMPHARLFRKELWREAMKAIAQFEGGQFGSIRESVWVLRNRHRANGRAVETRSVSRTLLVKGLEFDHALVPDADEFEDSRRPGEGARHFYVAATRGAKSLVVLSAASSVQFSQPAL